MAQAPYVLLNDQPVDSGQTDLLGAGDIAEGIASMLVASRASSPFVLAIDASWGMGKSTLLRQIESRLHRRADIVTLRFNAWTAEGENALEGLIKSVLGELDPNTVRRWFRRLAQQQRVMLVTRIGFALIARFFGMARLVDEIWTRLGGDSKSRNEMRGLIHGMLSDWIDQDGRHSPGRTLVVFIDDLDRCSDDVVVKVCEAVKLYLDVPGLIFVLACDQAVLARGVSSSARGGAGEGHMYLEKIVQVVYKVPLPEEAQIKQLIRSYAEQSGTSDLIDENVAGILAEGSGRNPRKIKRIINSFVLEYELDPSWRMPPLGSAQLVRAVLLQQLYSSFYDLLIREDSGEDPIGTFLKYANVRERVPEPPVDNPDDPWWETMRDLFQAHRLVLRFPAENADKEIKRLEDELPEDFRILVRNTACIALLRGIGDNSSRKSFRAQLIHRPLVTARVVTAPMPAVATTLADAVQAAHAEGLGFGDAVARDAPVLWRQAVLARKPRMPSDLEARLLQESALPIDALLHDEVRHALRRGFWDAMERAGS